MKPRHSSLKTTLPLLMAVSLLLLACGLLAPSTSSTSAPVSSGTAPVIETQAVESQGESATTTQSSSFDASQAGLPSDVPIYPGAHDFSGIPGSFVAFTVDTDVSTASAFYDKAMKSANYSGLYTGGAFEGECGGDCGSGPTMTPGPGPTATPLGWMSQNTQIWNSSTNQITINYTANAGGGTDIVIIISK